MDDSTARMFRLVLVLLMVFTEKLHEAINAPPNPPPPTTSTTATPGWRCQAAAVVIQRQFNLWQRRVLKFNATLQRAVSRRTQTKVTAADLFHARSNIYVKTIHIYWKIDNLFPSVVFPLYLQNSTLRGRLRKWAVRALYHNLYHNTYRLMILGWSSNT